MFVTADLIERGEWDPEGRGVWPTLRWPDVQRLAARGLGVEVIVLSFAVVVIGGLGSLPGAALGAIIVGVVRSLSVHYLPQIELFVIYFVMAMVLAFRPRGLFSLAEPRKI